LAKNIFLIGAGHSTTILIKYLLDVCAKNSWRLVVGDSDLKVAAKKLDNNPNGEAILFDVKNQDDLINRVNSADIVISMLPASLHGLVAKACLQQGVHLLTASYLNKELNEMNEAAIQQDLIMLYECGLDPGIDHMSALKVLDEIRENGGVITGFESFTGGLLAPNSDDNPWKYKFTWNPRNVVLAGQGVVKFIQEGRYKYIPYGKLFRRIELIHIPDYGYFEGYANRDSLKYREMYRLEDIKTMYRGTLRRPGFCKAWNIFIQLGATDDTYQLEGVGKMTHRQFVNSFLSYNPNDSVELKLAHYMNLDIEGEEMHKLQWLEIFSDELIGLEEGTPAQILEHILRKKWTMKENEGDMIVMWHKFNYQENGLAKERHATLVSIGKDQNETAMAKTVGLPLGIAAKLILTNVIKTRGVCAPTQKDIYEPILEELINDHEVIFVDTHIS